MKLVVPHGTLMGTPDGGLLEVFDPPWYRLDLWVAWWLRNGSWGRLSLPGRAQGVVVYYDADGDEHQYRVVATKVKLPRVMCEREAKSRRGQRPTTSRR